MNRGSVTLINKNPVGVSITASAARISTQEGTALEILARSGDHEKDLRLISKVLSSGHKSVIEHQTLSVAFNNVSLMVEQFVIEFRLASYTVKSRRYVDFRDAGYIVPEGMGDELFACYQARMEQLFSDYAQLTELGIPKEDARFLLPYSARSNFYMTVNARELIHMIATMVYGRGRHFSELKILGLSLKSQFDELYPGVIDLERSHYLDDSLPYLPRNIRSGAPAEGGAQLLGSPAEQRDLLRKALFFSEKDTEDLRLLLQDSRARELELLQYTFLIHNISLSCLTHFTRHRLLSPLIPSVLKALEGGDYVLPDSIRRHPEAEAIYRRAFHEQHVFAKELLRLGLCPEELVYCAMSGHVMDILLSLNAREMLHFAKLRTCTRAQWEIRKIAREMIVALSEVFPELFAYYGPSCAVTGKCPEGRMSCGKPVRIIDGKWMILGEEGLEDEHFG
ncbi:MAG: FAD-dependent thymidylate synthase [Christensenellales bacterium]|nr:FAD-dependent thymidylate synthase [Christensenellales bacterium]